MYDPLGRLRQMQGRLGEERFAFDPASNIQVSDEHEARGVRAPVLLDNLLKQYAGTRFEYDERGNLAVRVRNGERMAFGWDSFNRMVSAGDHRMQATYRYDALGRRITKLTEPCVYTSINDGPGYRDVLRARLKAEHGYGLTVYGWDGDTLACETDCEKRTVTHYVYEPGGFTPLLQASGPLGAGVDECSKLLNPDLINKSVWIGYYFETH